MLRLRLTSADLGKIIFAPTAPHTELVGSLQVLQQPTGVGQLDRWRRLVQRQLTPTAGALLDIVPPRGPIPGFLFPPSGLAAVGATSATFGEHFIRTPHSEIRGDIKDLPMTLKPWVRRLIEGDRREVGRLTGAAHDYQRAFVIGWRQARRHTEAELAHRAHLLLAGGLDRALSTLGPMVRWRNPVLEADMPVDINMSAGGKGLRLVPSVFWQRPVFCPDTITLVYPNCATPAVEADSESAEDPLTALLGQTRAAVLRSLVEAGGTTEVARRVGVSIASASEHAAVLRRAGLVATQRRGQGVRHTLTALGLALVRSGGVSVAPVQQRTSA